MQSFNTYGGTRKTPQSQPIPGREMVKNNAGGYTFEIDPLKQLKRFLILGTEGGSYYQSEQALTLANCKNLENLIKTGNGKQIVDVIVDVSDRGLAPKNDAALFSLAVIMSLADAETKRYASSKLSQVARIGTHILQFISYVDGLRGYGKVLRRAISNWYTEKPAEKTAFQVLKYGNRAGWDHRDVFRMVHPAPKGQEQSDLFRYIVKGEISKDGYGKANDLIQAYEEIKRTDSESRILELVEKYRVPMEFIPTEKRSNKVWAHVLPSAGLTFLIRNLGNLSKNGLLIDQNFDTIKFIKDKITNKEELHKSRIHPINILTAMRTYQSGHGLKGSGTWSPVQKIVDALDDAFYMAFENIEPSNKRHLLALDVSGSMGGGSAMGIPGLTPRDVSAVMAMATMKVEDNYIIRGFSTTFMPLKISPKMRMDQVIRNISNLPFSGTDCALPMVHALKERMEVDQFTIYTDIETWFGKIHPMQALREYRNKMGINAKLVVCSVTPTKFSIADPKDLGSLDIAGFSSETPALISAFAKDEF